MTTNYGLPGVIHVPIRALMTPSTHQTSAIAQAA
jgi:hypothetical protein